MPIASPEIYAQMLDRAKAKGFAYPAINVSSSQTLNAALAGLQAAGSDGIIQVTTGGGDYFSGPTIKNMATGAAAMAASGARRGTRLVATHGLHHRIAPRVEPRAVSVARRRRVDADHAQP